MPRLALALVLLLLAPTLVPMNAVATSAPARVEGPDEDGAWRLVYDVTRETAGSATLTLRVLRDDAGETSTGTRHLGARSLPAGPSRVEVTFLPSEGPGDYEVRLLVDGVEGAPATFRVEDAGGGTATVTLTVRDEPTWLNLTPDSVNADGKLKSPGDALVTRATLEDGNGAADVDTLRWRLEHAAPSGAWSLVDEAPLAFAPNGTRADVEHRLVKSPLRAGTHRVTLLAERDGATLASTSRTFLIRDVAPTLDAPAFGRIVVDGERVARVTATLADRNGLDAFPALETRVYKGSTRMETAGFAAIVGAPTHLAPDGGAARAAFDLTLRVPPGAALGAHRVSLYADGALLGSAAFELVAPPRLLAVAATPERDALRLDVRVEGDGILVATLGDDPASAATERVVDGNATLLLPAPTPTGALPWRLALHARADGPEVDAREGAWERAEPIVRAVPLRASSRLPQAWRLDAPGWDLADADATLAVTRWDGAAAAVAWTMRGDRVRIDAPRALETGLYTARLDLTLANGTRAHASWDFEAGSWTRIALGAPVVEGRVARFPIENTGSLDVRRLVVDAGRDDVRVLVLSDGAERPPARSDGARHAFAGLALAAGETASLVVALPEGPLRAGAHEIRVRVLALPGSA